LEDLSLHILDIAENSITAGAKNIEIIVSEDKGQDLLKIEIVDDGKGMAPEAAEEATNPFFTSRTTRRVGLGLSLLNEAAKMANGILKIQSTVGAGTRVTATFQLSHIDRKPLGNIAETLVTLIAGNPAVAIKYIYDRDGHRFIFDTREIKQRVPGKNISSAITISSVRKYIIENMENFP
jgi:anti-sigma regulatory factor (Ser/Thr protein kinase)